MTCSFGLKFAHTPVRGITMAGQFKLSRNDLLSRCLLLLPKCSRSAIKVAKINNFGFFSRPACFQVLMETNEKPLKRHINFHHLQLA